MPSDDWSAFEDRLERRLSKASRKQGAYGQSGKSVFMLKALMGRPKHAASKKRGSSKQK